MFTGLPRESISVAPEVSRPNPRAVYRVSSWAITPRGTPPGSVWYSSSFSRMDSGKDLTFSGPTPAAAKAALVEAKTYFCFCAGEGRRGGAGRHETLFCVKRHGLKQTERCALIDQIYTPTLCVKQLRQTTQPRKGASCSAQEDFKLKTTNTPQNKKEK